MEEIMSKVIHTLTYIRSNPFDTITMVFGMFAATLIAFKFPMPYLWYAFPAYVISATAAVISNRRRRNWPLVILFSYYFIIDTVGVFRWWPY